jgi:hypothetical protein
VNYPDQVNDLMDAASYSGLVSWFFSNR